jgi:hypothetical protein
MSLASCIIAPIFLTAATLTFAYNTIIFGFGAVLLVGRDEAVDAAICACLRPWLFFVVAGAVFTVSTSGLGLAKAAHRFTVANENISSRRSNSSGSANSGRSITIETAPSQSVFVDQADTSVMHSNNRPQQLAVSIDLGDRPQTSSDGHNEAEIKSISKVSSKVPSMMPSRANSNFTRPQGPVADNSDPRFHTSDPMARHNELSNVCCLNNLCFKTQHCPPRPAPIIYDSDKFNAFLFNELFMRVSLRRKLTMAAAFLWSAAELVWLMVLIYRPDLALTSASGPNGRFTIAFIIFVGIQSMIKVIMLGIIFVGTICYCQVYKRVSDLC